MLDDELAKFENVRIRTKSLNHGYSSANMNDGKL